MQLFSRYRSIAQVQKLLVFSVSLAVALSLYVYFTDGVIYYFISAKGTDEAYIIPSNDHITANSTFTTNSSQFLLTPATSSSKLLISVKSSPQSFAQRKAIRDSWGAQAKYLVIPVIFVLGKAKSSLVDDAIKAEHNHHKDILQGNFDDSYDNLPLKTLLFAEWFILSNQFQVTFYTDDDSLVFVLNLMALLTKLDLSLKLPFILGHCWPSGAPVLRRGKK